MKTPGRDEIIEKLSAYVDGELNPEERQQVEQHLANDKVLAGMVADLRAGDALMRHSLEMEADSIDWKTFTDDVMAKVTPEKLPFFDRLKLTLSEMFQYQRGPLVAGFAGAAVAVAIMVPVSLKLAGTPEGYGGTQVKVTNISVEDNALVKPLVMETDQGDAIIWVVENSPDGGKKKKDGEHSEETINGDPQGDL